MKGTANEEASEEYEMTIKCFSHLKVLRIAICRQKVDKWEV